MFCPGCGNEVAEGAKFCDKCGSKLTAAPVEEEAPTLEEVPAVEEAPAQEEVPVVEEAPAQEEVPAVEEAPALEEAPVVEEAPALEEAPVVEEAPVPVAAPAPKKAAKKAKKEAKKAEKLAAKAEKAERKAAKGKKKAWPWVVGILAFFLAAAVVFCLFWVNPYFAKKNAYEKGLACLQERDFDGALESFKKADDYEDAQVYFQDLQDKENTYLIAVKDMEEDRYADASQAFEQLADYKEKKKKNQACLLKLALACLAEQDMEGAYDCTDKMDASTYDKFLDKYEDTYADLKVFAIIEQLLEERLEAERGENPSLYAILEAEKNGLAIFDDLPSFADPDLEELVSLYCEGVEQQFASCTEDNYFDNHDFYEGSYARACAIEALIADYGFLEEKDALRESCVGTAEYLEAILELQYALEEGVAKAEEVKGADGKTYLPFTNTTETAAKLKFQNNFYKGDTYLGGNEAYLYILPGETVFIPVVKPGTEYDEWYIDWDFQSITANEKGEVEAGVYKLQSMIVDGVFYDLETLAKVDITPESVVVTIQEDGAGIWKEMGETAAITYSSSLIAIDGTDMRLPYTFAPGKIVVELGESTYVLTLDSLTA